ncbi:MAG: hypothetical protein ACOY46_13785 [Bacillota bacterium]
MDRSQLAVVVTQELMTTKEVLSELGISRARLSQLVKAKKLIPIKRSLFVAKEVLERKENQDFLREKFYRAPKISE